VDVAVVFVNKELHSSAICSHRVA